MFDSLLNGNQLMIFVTIVEHNETEHDNGIIIVPFKAYAKAMEYATAAAIKRDEEVYEEAKDDCDSDGPLDSDLGDILDRYNDINTHSCIGVQIRVTQQFNTPEFGILEEAAKNHKSRPVWKQEHIASIPFADSYKIPTH
jgi:hypothetical protein